MLYGLVWTTLTIRRLDSSPHCYSLLLLRLRREERVKQREKEMKR